MAHVEHDIAIIPGNKQKFPKHNIITTDIVCRLQYVAGHPNDATLVAMTTKHTIQNCPFTPHNTTIANKILGPNIYGLKGKRTHRSKDPVQTEDLVPIPDTIKKHCQWGSFFQHYLAWCSLQNGVRIVCHEG